MDCEKCKTEKATVFLTQILGGKMYKVDLCEKCAKDLGVLDASNFSLADLLIGMKGEEETEETGCELECPACGLSEADLRKEGRLGCPDCYEVFADRLKDVFLEMQRGGCHTGKTPQDQSKRMQAVRQVEELRRSLAKAIEEENFEKAAFLRDQLNTFHLPGN